MSLHTVTDRRIRVDRRGAMRHQRQQRKERAIPGWVVALGIVPVLAVVTVMVLLMRADPPEAVVAQYLEAVAAEDPETALDLTLMSEGKLDLAQWQHILERTTATEVGSVEVGKAAARVGVTLRIQGPAPILPIPGAESKPSTLRFPVVLSNEDGDWRISLARTAEQARLALAEKPRLALQLRRPSDPHEALSDLFPVALDGLKRRSRSKTAGTVTVNGKSYGTAAATASYRGVSKTDKGRRLTVEIADLGSMPGDMAVAANDWVGRGEEWQGLPARRTNDSLWVLFDSRFVVKLSGSGLDDADRDRALEMLDMSTKIGS